MALISWEDEGHWGLTCEEGDVQDELFFFFFGKGAIMIWGYLDTGPKIYNHKTLNSNPTEISAEWASNWV